jgi:hypothetical protein
MERNRDECTQQDDGETMKLGGTRHEHFYNEQFPRPQIYVIGRELGFYLLVTVLTEGWNKLLREAIDVQMRRS